MNKDILRVEGIHKVFQAGIRPAEILRGINFSVERGELVSICGPSGAGKSTFLNVLGGISRPSYGKVFLEGVDIYNLDDKGLSALRNKKIGMVFQFYNLLQEFTALENVMLPAMIAGNQARERAAGLLSELGLKDRLDHRPGELSGGEQQRVALARALINEPDVLLADEPTGNLDVENTNALFDLILKINEGKGQTMIIITHNLELAKRTKRIVEMLDGKIV
jgi:lipoprotein-releasing system ATP-binding protein